VNRVAIQRAIRAERAGRVASKSSVLLRRLLTRRVDCSKDVPTRHKPRPPGHHPEGTGEANRTHAKFERQYK
jgi:hypothetical protein